MRVVLACLLMAAACGDDGGSPGDAGDGGADAPADGEPVIAPPAPPMPPTVACADGFAEVSWDGVTACAPFDGGAQASCADGEAHLIGTGGCTPIGSPCPAGDWPADVPDGAVYVRAGATGGDGTRAAPHGTIEEALRRGIGTTVAIAKGTYAGPVTLLTRTTLIGACAAETILTTSEASLDGTVAIEGTGVVVRDLSVADAASSGIVLGSGSDATLEGVAIHRVAGYGLVTFRGATATADRLVIRDVNEYAGQAGRGVNAEGGSEITLTNASIEDVHDVGLFATGDGARLTASRTVVRGVTPPRVGANSGFGVLVQDGASIDLRASFVADTFDIGIFGNMGATLALSDVTIVDSLGPEDEGGAAIGVNERIDLVAERVFVRDASYAALAASAPTTTATLRDFVIADTGSGSVLNRGGVYCAGDAHCILERGVIARTEMAGVFGESEMTVIDVTDVSFLDAAPSEYRGTQLSRGIYVHYGTTANLSRVVIERAIDTGIFVTFGASVIAEDLVIRDVRPSATDGRMGRGVQAQVGSRFTLTRGVIEATGEGAVVAMSEGTVVELDDVVATQSAAPECAGDPGCIGIPGMLLASARGARVTATRFAFSRGDTCGVLVAEGGAMTLRDGTVSENPIGACIQVEGFDVSTLMEGVRYFDNDTNLQSTMLVVPESVDGIEM